MTTPSIFQIIIYLFPESLNGEKIKLTHVQYYLT